MKEKPLLWPYYVILKKIDKQKYQIVSGNLPKIEVEKEKVEFYTVDDIRNAVNFLLKEIKIREKKAVELKKDPFLPKNCTEWLLMGYKDCKKLIKKAFSGVVE